MKKTYIITKVVKKKHDSSRPDLRSFKSCMIKECPNSTLDNSKTFIPFPNCQDAFERWSPFIKTPNLGIYSKIFICSDHFKVEVRKCVMSMLKEIKEGALPIISGSIIDPDPWVKIDSVRSCNPAEIDEPGKSSLHDDVDMTIVKQEQDVQETAIDPPDQQPESSLLNEKDDGVKSSTEASVSQPVGFRLKVKDLRSLQESPQKDSTDSTSFNEEPGVEKVLKKRRRCAGKIVINQASEPVCVSKNVTRLRNVNHVKKKKRKKVLWVYKDDMDELGYDDIPTKRGKTRKRNRRKKKQVSNEVNMRKIETMASERYADNITSYMRKNIHGVVPCRTEDKIFSWLSTGRRGKRRLKKPTRPVCKPKTSVIEQLCKNENHTSSHDVILDEACNDELEGSEELINYEKSINLIPSGSVLTSTEDSDMHQVILVEKDGQWNFFDENKDEFNTFYDDTEDEHNYAIRSNVRPSETNTSLDNEKDEKSPHDDSGLKANSEVNQDDSASDDSLSERSLSDFDDVFLESKPILMTNSSNVMSTNIKKEDFIGSSVMLTNSKNKSKRVREKDHCYYCENLVLNFARHLQRKHQTETEVVKIFSLPANSKERKELITSLRKKGNFYQYREAAKPMRKVKNTTEYLPCTNCMGMYSRKFLWKHKKICSENSLNRNIQSMSQTFLCTLDNIDEELKMSVFPTMRPDQISLIAKKDYLICLFGARYMKNHREKHFINVASRKMRELARLLIEMKERQPDIPNLFEALQPQYYDTIVESVKQIALFDSGRQIYKSPTYAINIAGSLKQCCDIAIQEVMKNKNRFSNEEVKTRMTTLIQLFESNWRFDVSHNAANTLNINKCNKVTIVPLAQDIKVFKNFLSHKAKVSVEQLVKSNADKKAYTDLLYTIYCRIILLNRRRPGELQQMPIHVYDAFSGDNSSYENFNQALTSIEKILLNQFKCIVVRGKYGCGVPVFISPEVQNDIQLLIKFRNKCVPEGNIYLFGLPDCYTPIVCFNVLKKMAKEAGVSNPKAISSAKLRKHLATLSQLFDLKEAEIEKLASFMGHALEVQKNSYMLQDDVHQTAKMSKLLLLMENGQTEAYKGKNLEQININLDEIIEDESDDENEIMTNFETRFHEQERCSHEQRKTVPEKTAAGKMKKRVLVPWTTEQKQLVKQFFKSHIKTKTAPKKRECEKLISLHPTIFSNKNWLKMKVYVQNEYTKK
ncbi:uncharacterized protein LOC106662998 isoform X2 [Cimex lectularius]|uniref:THAP-type domain-containing protein n=1 Tax=Cimex lectularius TaxID=79782 RepID=A0A8I6SRS1_CIMLE|nr:uncharacterized protein LOC106662998 isoform X2 [Cimex lectularius]